MTSLGMYIFLCDDDIQHYTNVFYIMKEFGHDKNRSSCGTKSQWYNYWSLPFSVIDHFKSPLKERFDSYIQTGELTTSPLCILGKKDCTGIRRF